MKIFGDIYNYCQDREGDGGNQIYLLFCRYQFHFIFPDRLQKFLSPIYLFYLSPNPVSQLSHGCHLPLVPLTFNICAFYYTPFSWRCWGIQLLSDGVKVQIPFSGVGGGWGQTFSEMFGQSRVVIAYKLSCQAASLLVILLEGTALCWNFFFFGISMLPASLPPSLGFTKTKENLGNSLPCHTMNPEVLSWSAFFLPFRVFLCFIYNFQGIQFSVRGTGRSAIDP